MLNTLHVQKKEALWNLPPIKHSLNQCNSSSVRINNEAGGQRSVAVNVLRGSRGEKADVG